METLSHAPSPTIQQQSGLTPFQRRYRSVQHDSPILSSSAPWTTARCKRLLRPLSSRIALLRKQRERELERKSNHLQKAAMDDTLTPQGNDKGDTDRACQASYVESSSQDDPDWTNEYRPRKKLKRTYSGKGNSQKMGRAYDIPSLNSHAVYDVDFVRNDCLMKASTSMRGGGRAEDSSLTKAPAKSDLTRESFRRLAKSLSPADWMLNDGLYTGLEALLKATAKSKPARNAGARSLFATCLRHVPHVIAQEHRWVEEEEEDEDAYTKITTSVYEDLESLGQGDNGWRPLREVVRAHGVAMLGDAIKQSYVKPAIARCLIILCLQASAYEEAESLVESMLYTREPMARPSNVTDNLFQRCLPMRTLWDFARLHNRWRFLFRQLTRDIETRFLPVEWMACYDVAECWNSVFRSMRLQDDAATDATALFKSVVWMSHNDGFSSSADIVHMLRLLSRGRATLKQLENSVRILYASSKGQAHMEHERNKIGNVLTQTMSGWLTHLIQVSNDWATQNNLSCSNPIQDILSTVSSDCQVLNVLTSFSTGTIKLTTHDARFCFPLLANYFVIIHHNSDTMSERFRTALKRGISRIDAQNNGIDNLAYLIYRIACPYDKALEGSTTSFHYIQDMLHSLQDLLCIDEYNEAYPNIKRLILETAFMFAEQQPKREHLDWALEVEDEVQGLATGNQQQPITPARRAKTPIPIFKWEESLSEWVAKTPAPTYFMMTPVLKQRHEGPSLSSSDDESVDASTPNSLRETNCSLSLLSPVSLYGDSKRTRSETEETFSLSKGVKRRDVAFHPKRRSLPNNKAPRRQVFKDVTNSVNDAPLVMGGKVVCQLQPRGSWTSKLEQERLGLKRKSLDLDRGEDISEDELGL